MTSPLAAILLSETSAFAIEIFDGLSRRGNVIASIEGDTEACLDLIEEVTSDDLLPSASGDVQHCEKTTLSVQDFASQFLPGIRTLTAP